jgi:hypothetical protein
MTIMNFTIALCILLYAGWLLPRCRPEVKPMMWVFFSAGVWSFSVHSAVVCDKICYDFMPWQFVTDYLIRPLIFVLQCVILSAIIKAGWRYDH